MNTIEEKINQVIFQLSPIKIINKDMNIRVDLGFDSLSIVTLIVSIENALEITIDESQLDPDDFNRVEDLYNLEKRYVH